MTTTFNLDRTTIERAEERAMKMAQVFEGRQGKYGGNDAQRQFTGALGEEGLAGWAEAQGFTVERTFLDRLDDRDLMINGHRVEVKSCARHNWLPRGRTVPPKQFDSVSNNSDIIVWVIVDRDDSIPINVKYSVEVGGWNSPADLKQAMLTTYKGTPGYQLSIDLVNPATTLSSLLRNS